MTPEFMMNYPHLSQIDIGVICLGAARILFNICLPPSPAKDAKGYFFRIKKIFSIYWPYFKKNILYSLVAVIVIYVLFTAFINVFCVCLGITPNTNSFFSFYIFILTKVILINSIISLFLLAFTKSSEERCNIVGMSIWLPVTLLPSTLFYYYWILPELILIRLALVDMMHIRVTRLEQDLYEFKIAILYIVDDIEIILTHLKAKLSCLEPLFFLSIRNLGKQLIIMHNRPGQLGKFLVQWANLGLDEQPESMNRKQNTPANHTQNSGVGFLAKNKYYLARNYDNIRHWEMVKYWPKITSVGISLPFSARGSNTIASSLAYQTISSRIFFANFSSLEFKGSFHTFMQNSENVRGFFSAMENLGELKFIFSGNSTVEFKRIGLNIVKVICIDNSRAGFLEFDIKDLVRPDFIPSCNISNGLDSIMGVKQIGFCGKNSPFDIQAWSDGLTTKSYQIDWDETLANTDPSKIGYNCNPQVYMQSNTSHDNPIYSGESSRGDLVQNRGTKRAREGSHIGDEGHKCIQVKALNTNNPIVSLKFDLNKLSRFTEDNSIKWKDYLEVICTEAREAFIKAWGSDMVEKATMDNIFVDYADDTEQKTHAITLCNAIKQAAGKDISWNNFFLLSKDFMESFGTQSKDNVYTETDYTEDSESESEEIIDNTEHYNYNNSYILYNYVNIKSIYLIRNKTYILKTDIFIPSFSSKFCLTVYTLHYY